MKKISNYVLVLLCLFAITKTSEQDIRAETHYIIEENIMYILDDVTKTASVKGRASTSETKDVVLLDKVNYENNEYKVKSIDNFAFSNNQLTSVIIPNSITSIGGSAFLNNQLTSVTIPDSVTSIASDAFLNNQLTSVTIPDSVTSIGNYAFSNNQLTSVIIPNSVTSIGSGAFNRNKLTTLEIPDSITFIGHLAFLSNQLTSVTIPNSVTSIGNSAFLYNKLTSVTIPDSVTSIGDDAFALNKLTSVEIPDSVTFIGTHTFENNPSMNTVFINKVAKLDDIVDLLKTGEVFKSGNSSAATVRMYALDNIQARYTNETKEKYELNKGVRQALSVDKTFYPEVKTIDATFNSYNDPEGVDRDIDLDQASVEWFKDNISIGTGKDLTAKSAGTYHAVVNGKYKLSDIVITYKKVDEPNTGNTNTDNKNIRQNKR